MLINLLASFGLAETRSPRVEPWIVLSRVDKLALHGVEPELPLGGESRRGLNLGHQGSFGLTKHAVSKVMAFPFQARRARALTLCGGGEKQRRRRHAEPGRLDVEQRPDQPIGHLVIKPPADAVDKLIERKEPEEQRER